MVFEDLKLLATNCVDFKNFCGTCVELEKWWGDCNWNIEEAYFSTHFRPYQVDQISRHIIPSKYADLVPIRSTGDGNCLFNSASLAICKNESRAFELQLRTCLELARNNDFYKNHPVLVNSKVITNLEDKVQVLCQLKLCAILPVWRKFILRIWEKGFWCSIWKRDHESINQLFIWVEQWRCEEVMVSRPPHKGPILLTHGWRIFQLLQKKKNKIVIKLWRRNNHLPGT